MAALKWKVTLACWFGLTKQQIDSTESTKTSKRKKFVKRVHLLKRKTGK